MTDLLEKTDRCGPSPQTRSELEIDRGLDLEEVDGRDMIRKQPFVRLRATLATAATSLSEDIPAYDPVAIINANQPIAADDAGALVNTDIYGAEVEGEVAIKLASLPMTFVPPRAISDQGAAEFVRLTVEGAYARDGPDDAWPMRRRPTRACATSASSAGDAISGVAENVTRPAQDDAGRRSGPRPHRAHPDASGRRARSATSCSRTASPK